MYQVVRCSRPINDARASAADSLIDKTRTLQYADPRSTTTAKRHLTGWPVPGTLDTFPRRILPSSPL